MTRRIYLNQAGTSWPKAPGVLEAVEHALRVDPAQHGALFEESRQRIATALGIHTPAHLLLTPGCTAALSSALYALPWAEGDVVITSALEHRAVLGPIESLVRSRGIQHRVVPLGPEAPFDLAAFQQRLSTPRVRAVVVSAASNVTGERLPIESIVAATRDAGIFCLIDAAQTAGLVHLDVEGLGADAVAFAGHKGPLGPQGIGGLWCREGLASMPGYCDVGSVNLAGAVGLATGLEWLASAPTKRAHALAMRERLHAACIAREDCRVLGGPGPSTTALSLVHARLPLEQAEAHFASYGIIVRAGRHCAPQALEALGTPRGTLRISFGVFNRDDDVQAVLAALDAVPVGVSQPRK